MNVTVDVPSLVGGLISGSALTYLCCVLVAHLRGSVRNTSQHTRSQR